MTCKCGHQFCWLCDKTWELVHPCKLYSWYVFYSSISANHTFVIDTGWQRSLLDGLDSSLTWMCPGPLPEIAVIFKKSILIEYLGDWYIGASHDCLEHPGHELDWDLLLFPDFHCRIYMDIYLHWREHFSSTRDIRHQDNVWQSDWAIHLYIELR